MYAVSQEKFSCGASDFREALDRCAWHLVESGVTCVRDIEVVSGGARARYTGSEGWVQNLSFYLLTNPAFWKSVG